MFYRCRANALFTAARSSGWKSATYSNHGSEIGHAQHRRIKERLINHLMNKWIPASHE